MNDAALTDLLNQLRATQDPPASLPPPFADPVAAPSDESQYDAALRAQRLLSSFSAPSASALSSLSARDPSALPASPVRQQDPASMSFSAAVPVLTRMAEDPRFVEKVEEIQRRQNDEELRLKDQRNRIKDDAKRIGLSLGAQEEQLRNWDRGALKSWAALRSAQQKELQKLNVPTFSVTDDPIALGRQRKVIDLLMSFIEDLGSGSGD